MCTRISINRSRRWHTFLYTITGVSTVPRRAGSAAAHLRRNQIGREGCGGWPGGRRCVVGSIHIGLVSIHNTHWISMHSRWMRILYICCVHMQWVYMQQRVWNACGCNACRCKILQQTATRCNIVQRTAAHCNALQYTATHCHAHRSACRAWYCNTLQHSAAHCSTLQHTATHCNSHCNACRCKQCVSMQDTAITHCNTLQHTAEHCSTVQDTATHCHTLPHALQCVQMQAMRVRARAKHAMQRVYIHAAMRLHACAMRLNAIIHTQAMPTMGYD